MKPVRRVSAVSPRLLVLGIFLLVPAGIARWMPLRAQQPMQQSTPAHPMNTPGGMPDFGMPGIGAASPDMAHRQQLAQNNERQRRLVADTDKLLALATQLHADVAKTDKNILSVDVVKRAEEIERLARSVKEKMKG